MNRRILIATLIAGALFLIGRTVFAADSLPTPDAIMNRYIEVTGGKKVYDARKSEIAHGRLEYTAIGIKGTITRYAAVPDFYYASLDIEGLGKVEMGVNKGIAWENSAVLGPRVKTGEERGEAIREAVLDSTVGWRRLYPKAETVGTETIDGEECYKVVMTPLEGQPLNRFFQKKSGLEVKTTTIGVTQMGEIPIELMVSDYKNLGGILTPARVTQKAGGQEFTIIMESIEANPPIPVSRFDLPAEVQALVAKGAAAAK